jgi:hypothetical protein
MYLIKCYLTIIYYNHSLHQSALNYVSEIPIHISINPPFFHLSFCVIYLDRTPLCTSISLWLDMKFPCIGKTPD